MPAPDAPDEHHSEPDQADTGGLARARSRPEHRHADEEHQHRRHATGDRVDDRDVGVAVRRRERCEVRELEHRSDRDERPDARVSVEPPDRERREEHDRSDERDRRRRLRVALPAEDEVPEGMEKCRAEREGEGVERHRTTLDRLPARRAPAPARGEPYSFGRRRARMGNRCQTPMSVKRKPCRVYADRSTTPDTRKHAAFVEGSSSQRRRPLDRVGRGWRWTRARTTVDRSARNRHTVRLTGTGV